MTVSSIVRVAGEPHENCSKILTPVLKRRDQLEEEAKRQNSGMKNFNYKMNSQSSEVANLVKDVSETKPGMPSLIREKVSEVLI
ncbi:hypothetical protein DPMN_053534 [Dreissena polymorpha]|uniref:Uncharacterized protein n=1 Tax=Dreissena polymorpha TaxID=45954 RepID=A0A9D4CNT9_DREPO|nr:hypothetical protein DPMN_053534 [Dreissena polymorpha]